MQASFTVNVKGMPELIWACRHAMADLLRETAAAEASNLVAERLREVAVRFETGTKES